MVESMLEPEHNGVVLPFRSTKERPVVELKLREVVGDVLREERTLQGRTLADVARSASVSLPYLSEVERGRKDVSSDVLAAIGVALELPVAEILERSAQRLRARARQARALRARAESVRAQGVRMQSVNLRVAA
jgi:transcriptional regulator with XRE-family HTH domain